jgi:hypothetical protein
MHVAEHTSQQQYRCEWSGCKQAFKKEKAVYIYLLNIYGVYTRATIPMQARFCLKCA